MREGIEALLPSAAQATCGAASSRGPLGAARHPAPGEEAVMAHDPLWGGVPFYDREHRTCLTIGKYDLLTLVMHHPEWWPAVTMQEVGTGDGRRHSCRGGKCKVGRQSGRLQPDRSAAAPREHTPRSGADRGHGLLTDGTIVHGLGRVSVVDCFRS